MRFVNWVALFVYALLVMWMMLDIRWDEHTKRKMPWAALCAVAIVGINLWVYAILPYGVYTRLFPLFVQMPTFAVFALLARYRGMKLLFVLLSAIVWSGPPVIAGTMAWTLSGSYVVRGMVQIMCYPLMLWMLCASFAPLLRYMLQNCDRGWGGFCLVPMIYYCITYLYTGYDFKEAVWDGWRLLMACGLNLLIFAVYYLLLTMFRQTREVLVSENEREMLRLEAQAAQQRLEKLEQAQMQMAEYRHDLRHHLQFISTALKQGNIEQTQSYLATLSQQIADTSVQKYCCNHTVNLILSSFAQRAAEKNVPMNIQADIAQTLNVADIELCVILSNVLENAIHACEGAAQAARWVELRAAMQGKRLFLSVRNPSEGPVVFEDGLPLSAAPCHGLGTKSVRSVVNQHGGMCTFTEENGIFCFKALL